LGAFLLLLPFAHIGEVSAIDAIFTSASATCVTGLIVTSTSKNFTFWGEFIILSLIQIGGIGYMTLVTFFFLYLKDSLSVDEKRMMMHSLDLPTLNIKIFVRKVIYIVFAIELIGAMVLTYKFEEIYPFKEAL
jgi:trk system potassium uptake protein TrkH